MVKMLKKAGFMCLKSVVGFCINAFVSLLAAALVYQFVLAPLFMLMIIPVIYLYGADGVICIDEILKNPNTYLTISAIFFLYFLVRSSHQFFCKGGVCVD